MADIQGQWVWFTPQSLTENVVGCFTHAFRVPKAEPVRLRMFAQTRYVVCLNGKEVGRGPIRSFPGKAWYDTYDISSFLLPEENLLSVRVWDYGMSTYQTIASRPGLVFDITQGEKLLACSGEETRARRDKAHIYNVPKRNVNLGFMEVQDARLSEPFWQEQSHVSAIWNRAVPIEAVEENLASRPVPHFAANLCRPKRVAAKRKVELGSVQVTLNTRSVFFPERVNANDSIFSGVIGVEIYSRVDQEGVISFPNRTWNGIIGDFRIGKTLYGVDNSNRDIKVKLKAGAQLFLLQVAGKYDDLYCHIDFCFEEELIFGGEGGAEFFVVGPTEYIASVADGRSRVYGGLEEYDKMEQLNDEQKALFSCTTLEELRALSSAIKPIPKEYVIYNQYVYSLLKNQRMLQEEAVTLADGGMLHGNGMPTIVPVPAKGSQQFIVDFGEQIVGPIQFTLRAPQGTILEFYGFENFYHDEIDFTVGLNNALRYICREGMQQYTAMTRMGCRYLVITLRGQSGPVELYEVALTNQTYPTSGMGSFRCGDDKLNRIWEMCKETHRNCMEDTFTDSPTYEQCYWLGDALISAYINAWMYGEYPLLRHCLVVGAGMSYTTPLMNALGPTDWTTCIPMWSMNWLLAIDHYVQMSGDESVVQELYPAVEALMQTFEDFVTEDGGFLLNAWHMLDWAAMDIHNNCVVTGEQALLAGCCNVTAKFAKMLGKQEEADKWMSLRQRLMQYLDTVLWNDKRKAYMDGWSPEHGLSKTVSVQSHSLLILNDAIALPERKEAALLILDETDSDVLQAGSPFFLFYIYSLWAEQDVEKMLHDIRVRWTEMMRYDCTTCWEVFPGFYEVGRTRSYCHSWSASPAYFMSRYLLGVHPTEPGFKKVELRLQNSGLDWCEGTIPTPYGNITVFWSTETGEKKYTIKTPKEVVVEKAADFDWKVEIIRLS